ncbi:MAG: biopolymer transporter ExbB [Sphingobacteriaceae bacterium]|nr:biopolymer transporter ExbB [Sphingobacteriaceae bacterium]
MASMSLFLQITESTLPQPTEERLNLLELVFKGGFFMIPLVILSFIAVYIFVERYMTIKKARKEDSQFMNLIKDFVASGNIHSAQDLCNKTDHPLARMMAKGVMRIGRPLKDIETAVENVGKIEVGKLEKNMGTLATIAGAAPMIGFLGTVTGMIRAFYNMSKAGNNIDPGLLSGGIYEAMITTAAGLVVGIIAFIGYNFLVSMIDKVVHNLETRSVEFLDLLQEPSKK